MLHIYIYIIMIILETSYNYAHNINTKYGTGILFEVKDRKGNYIFSDVTAYKPKGNSVLCYINIKENPPRLKGKKNRLSDGTAVLTVVYKLTNVPEKYRGTYNGRSTFTYDLTKTLPNISPIVFGAMTSFSDFVTCFHEFGFELSN